MQALTHYPETENSRKNFYPTPLTLINKMLEGIDWNFVSSVLEPSAGKGDIAQILCDKLRYKSNNYCEKMVYSAYDVDCVEIDSNLRAILKEKGFKVVHDDFLTMETAKHYDLIMMNPPFDHGAEHLLKALRMQEKGGAIVCLLNAETLRNPGTYIKKLLVKELERLQADITYHERAFIGAERSTYADIAMVKCHIPVQEEESTILDGLRRDFKKDQDEEEQQKNDVAKGNYIDAIVDRFNFEAQAGTRLIREYRALLPYLKNEVKDTNASPILDLTMHGSRSYSSNATVNEFLKAIRKKYWKALFENPEFVKNLTSNLRQELYSHVEKLADYDFSVYNIMELRVQMSKKVVGGIEETIMKLFDDWTRKYHWDENSTNRHYFDGWRANDAFSVNKKVIFPIYEVWYWGKYNPSYKAEETLSDIEKVFDYLDGQSTSGAVRSILQKAEKEMQTKKIQMRYFTVTFYMKGTCHIEFTNMEVLHKFNLFAARGKNWLPPCYGKKRYKDMTPEEKKVVDSFEGEKSYNHVLERRDYFLQETQTPALMGV